MNRVKKSKERYKQMFGDGVPAAYATDPDFQDILSHFVFGEVFHQGNLNVGNSKETMITAITHCLPYMGFPRTLNALSCVNEVIPEK